MVNWGIEIIEGYFFNCFLTQLENTAKYVLNQLTSGKRILPEGKGILYFMFSFLKNETVDSSILQREV